MSIHHRMALIFLAASMLSIPVLAEGNYSINLSTDKFLGSYLVNQSGFSLYYFSGDKDANGESTCYGECAVNWPPFYARTMILPESLRSADFFTIVRSDGSNQTTFRGWPLYLYARDREAGDAYGEGRDDGLWHVVRPEDQPQLF